MLQIYYFILTTMYDYLDEISSIANDLFESCISDKDKSTCLFEIRAALITAYNSGMRNSLSILGVKGADEEA